MNATLRALLIALWLRVVHSMGTEEIGKFTFLLSGNSLIFSGNRIMAGSGKHVMNRLAVCGWNGRVHKWKSSRFKHYNGVWKAIRDYFCAFYSQVNVKISFGLAADHHPCPLVALPPALHSLPPLHCFGSHCGSFHHPFHLTGLNDYGIKY